jgi:small subunit ribosomal protein S16
MVIIRLQRIGRRNHAEFRIVIGEHKKSAKSGKILAVLGNYNPHTDTATFDADVVKAWIAKGAQVSDTVHNILVSKGVLTGKKKNVLPKKTVPKKEEVPATEVEAPAPAETVEATA